MLPVVGSETMRRCGGNSSLPALPSTRTLGIITFMSHDAPQLCPTFMDFYIKRQRLQPSDIFVVAIDVLQDAQRCFDAARLPKGNVRRAEWPGRGYNETFRLHLFEGLQYHLLHELQYTHSLIVDIDELLLPSPRYAGSLRTYLQHSSFAHRRYVMPTAYVVLPAPALGEPTGLNWTSRPLLARRHTWMRECGLSKVVLTRVRATYTSSTHQAKELPWYNPFMCIKTWGRDPAESLRDCVDPQLVLIHKKCADPEMWTAPAPQLIASWQRDPDTERKRWAEYQSHFWQTYAEPRGLTPPYPKAPLACIEHGTPLTKPHALYVCAAAGTAARRSTGRRTHPPALTAEVALPIRSRCHSAVVTRTTWRGSSRSGARSSRACSRAGRRGAGGRTRGTSSRSQHGCARACEDGCSAVGCGTASSRGIWRPGRLRSRFASSTTRRGSIESSCRRFTLYVCSGGTTADWATLVTRDVIRLRSLGTTRGSTVPPVLQRHLLSQPLSFATLSHRDRKAEPTRHYPY